MSARHEEIRRKIVDAALKIADEEGFEAVSMRRVSAEVGMGTMTIYTYVENKDDLVYLASDRVGEHLLLDEIPADWREALTAIASQSYRVMLTWPWMLKVGIQELKRVPPSLASHVEQMLQALEPLGVERVTAMEIQSAVESLVWGVAGYDIQAAEMSPEADEAFRSGWVAVADEQEFPRLHEVAAEGFGSVFEQALQWLLDGIEARYAAVPRA